MVDLRKRKLCILIRPKKGNKESGKSIYFYFLFFFCTLFSLSPSRKSTQQLKKKIFHHIHNFLSFFFSIFRWVAFGLIDGADLNLNGSMRDLSVFFLFFLLLLAPFHMKIQCFGNLAL